jgi:N-acetylneuraminate synthase
MFETKVKVGNRLIGDGEPVFIIGEIGINHNGSLEMAKRLIDGAVFAGCDAVKFQKRTPELCVPYDQWTIERDTPWGRMTYIDYKHRIEFGRVDFVEQFDPPLYKAASASLTDLPLLRKIQATGKPLMLSSGMSQMGEIETAVTHLDPYNLLLAHSTSAYPCPVDQLNLRMILTLKARYPDIPIGYSGHEVGLAPTWAAVALGATFVERHITLDRAMWGTDQAASVEVMGLHHLVRDIRDIEKALGDGIKRVYPAEEKMIEKLRRVKSAPMAESYAVPAD